MDSHPLTPGILEIVGAYERLRMAGSVREETRRTLQELNKDFVLIPGKSPEFVEAQVVPNVAGGREVRACVGPRTGGAVASLWHYLGKEGKLIVASESVAAIDLAGQCVELKASSGTTAIPIDHRRTLVRFAALAPEDVAKLLAKATFEAR